jgi:hypothetical protein
MPRGTQAFCATVLAAALLASCASDDTSTASSPAGATTTAAAAANSSTTTTTTTTTTNVDGTTTASSVTPAAGAIDPGLQPYIDRSVTDLSGRLDVGVEDIIVVAAILVEWPDSSLGCPQPGTQYAQGLTDGSLITLAIDGDTYEYHAGGDTTPFLCETPTDKSPAVTISAP